jgi:hypothetical protein
MFSHKSFVVHCVSLLCLLPPFSCMLSH